MTTEVITVDLKATLRRLKLGRLLDTLPERLTLARQQAMPHQDFLLVALASEADRRQSQAAELLGWVRSTSATVEAHLPRARRPAWRHPASPTARGGRLPTTASVRPARRKRHPAPLGRSPWRRAP